MKSFEQISTIPLNHIIGPHHRILELNSTCSQLPYLDFLADDFSKDCIQSILSLRPIIVRKAKGGFTCIGNMQSYILAKKCLSPDANVQVTINKRKNLSEIDKLYWSENLLLHFITDIGPKKTSRISALWKEFRSSEVPWKNLPLPRLTTLTKLKAMLNRK